MGYTTVVTDALNNGLYLEYDASNNWTRRENAGGQITLYEYDGQGNLITETNHYGATTIHSYNAFGQRLGMSDANGVSSQYGYDPIGQMVVITNAQGLTSTFAYDDIGRLITTTDVFGKMSVNLYDGGNNLLQATGNVLPGYPQNYLDEYNIITRYGYDGVGHQIAVTDTLGMVNLALYDDAGRVVTQVVNYDGITPIQQLCTDFTTINPEYNICSLSEYDAIGRLVATTDTLGHINRTFYDEQGRVAGTVNNWSGLIADTTDLPSCLNLPIDRDSDVCTLFGYDDVGNGIIMTDTVGQMTRSYYDELGRIEGMIMNWDGQTTLDSCLTLSPLRDDNVCMTFGYDEVGNTIIMTDTLGQMTRTFYDMLGRETAVVANWNPATLSSPDQCVRSSDNNNTENICSVTTYDDIGNPTVTTNALGQRMLSVYDDSNRPFIQVTNWDGTPITSEADCEFPPTDTSVNLCTVTRYDLYGRPYATVNPMGDENQMAFDSAGRIITTTRYLDGAPIHSTVQYDAMGHRLSQTDANGNSSSAIYDTLYRPVASISAGGIVVTTTYNAAGQTLTATNGLGHNTTMQYDALGRLTYATDAENNVTRYEYDVMGNKTAIIDPNNIRTSYEYDELRRLVHVIENDTGGTQTDDSNILTQYTYNVLGSQISIVNGRNHTSTHMIYDELYRPIRVEDALGNAVTSAYNALGHRTVMTDANGAVTTYSYDTLGRLSSINYLDDGETVSYLYDALGKPVVMTDTSTSSVGGTSTSSVGVTRYEYDDLYRLITVTNPFTGTVGYGYDNAGNRTHLTYPDGKIITYTYNSDNQLVLIQDWDNSITTYEYDEIGRLTTTTLPNGVVSVNQYDNANRLLRLTHTDADDNLLADFHYEVDGVGNRQMVTETLRTLEIVEIGQAYQEANGFLTIEAENGIPTAGSSHNWISQTVQTGYAGSSYLRVLPDIGQHNEVDDDSPHQSFSVQIENPADYTVWIRGMAPDAGGDSAHISLHGSTASPQTLTGFTDEWSWSRQTMSNTQAALPLNESGFYTLTLSMREDGLRIDRLLLITDTNYIPSGSGPAESAVQIITATASAGLNRHTIQYTYDPLHRLTNASYTGSITATYQYEYDAVGNMTTYTDSVNGNTVSVFRTFDAANRMQNSTDSGSSELTTFTYDGNGNMISQLTGAETTGYAYNQRNLLLTMTQQTGSDPIELVAAYTYDGTGNRLRQTIYDSGSPAEIITYTNDIMGLTQVLVADDGAKQVYNLYGLDLIGQQANDDPQQRLLLADGLGSVRQEMMGNTVEAITSYDPYGNLLTQTGTSGTTYGYTGEQTDSNGLLYLRARYYNPAQRTFQSRDPWPGSLMRPQSMNGWSYVENNPINFADPTGMIPFPTVCREADSYAAYGDCLRSAYGVSYIPGDYEEFLITNKMTSNTVPEPGCFEGPVPYRATGHIEGGSLSAGILFAFNDNWGEEKVWDFATMEATWFDYSAKSWFGQHYDPVWSTTILGISGQAYVGKVNNFRSWTNVVADYEGQFSYSGGGGHGPPPEVINAKVGFFLFNGDFKIRGYTAYAGIGVGFGFPWVDWEDGITDYSKTTLLSNANVRYGTPGRDGSKANAIRIIYDIMTSSSGSESLILFAPLRILHLRDINKYVQAFNGIQIESYLSSQ